ncbi:hypothetical protein M2267_001581 [Ensifer sp. KUDG1]|uniref:hypothetical protein n=1 Tax=unclassified Ensifer TaxID=2633371 RepID=UPI003D193DF3
MAERLHFLTILPGPLVVWLSSNTEILKPLMFEGWRDDAIAMSCAIGAGLVLIYCLFLGSPPDKRRSWVSAAILSVLFVCALVALCRTNTRVDAQVGEDAIRLWRDTYLYWVSMGMLLTFQLMVAAILTALFAKKAAP